MDFDEWMAGVAPTYSPTDDSVTLRILRRCWIEAQAAERERCAKLCESARDSIWDYHVAEVKDAARNVCTNLAAAIRGN